MASFSSTTVVFLVALLFAFAEARDHLVGGKDGAWKVPSSEADSLNKWAESTRFRIGDNLVWKIEDGKDSVLQVTGDAYRSCNTTNPVAAYTATNEVKVKLGRSGPFFFISGVEERCTKGEKMIVVVLSSGRRGSSSFSPAPAPMEYEGPAVAPTSAASVLRKSGFVGSLLFLMAVLLL